MGSWCDRLGDLREVQVHRLGVAGWQDQGRALAFFRADGAEDVGRGGALITGSARASTALRPPAGDLVLLADACLVRKPNFYLVAVDAPSRARLHPGALGNFFKILDHALGLRMMAWTSREFAVAHGAQLPAERLLGDRDAELLEYPLREINQPPAHHPVDRRDRAALDHPRNRLALRVIELRGLPWRLAVQETVRPPRVEPQHPVPDDLKPNAADLRRLGARRAVIDRGKSQKPSSLRAILRLPRQASQLRRLEIPAEADTAMTNLHRSPR